MLGQKDRGIESILPHGEQADLEWFFGRGQVAFERSPMGDMLRRAELRTFGSMMCRGCKGNGYRKSEGQVIREAIEKLRKWQEMHAEQIADGRIQPETIRGSKRFVPADYDDGSCRSCQGSGWVPRARRYRRLGAITARPMQTEKSDAQEPSTDDLERYGWVSHRLTRVGERTAHVLAGFFGVGIRWQDDRRLGRIFGVMPMTPAGKTLLKASRDKTKSEDVLPNDLILATEMELNLTQRKPRRTELLEAARKQAEEMLRAAEDEWRGSESTRRRPKPPGTPKAAKVYRPVVRDMVADAGRRLVEEVTVERVAS